MKILVIDDHPLIQSALADALPALDDDIEAVAATTRDEARVALARHADYALVLLDLTLPGARGLDLLAELRRDYPLLPILVLSATRDPATVSSALAAGARGYVAKTADSVELLEAIRSVLDGARGITVSIASARARTPDLGLEVLGLTQRQSDVLELLVQGKPNKTICRDLKLSEGTVKVHVSAILKALNVHSRSQAIVELAKRGVVVDGVAARQ
jgi:DNA-binding NarL/FixJ family response regulator